MPRYSFQTAVIIFSFVVTFTILLFASGGHVDPLSGFSSDRKVDTFDFHNTATERECISKQMQSSDRIPNIVHVIWLNNPELNFMNYLTMRAALVSLRPDKLMLHYTSLNKDNEWFLKLHNSLTLVPHNLQDEYPVQMEEEWQISHISDLLRLDIIYKEGGIYLDMDVISLQSFDALLHSEKDVILGHEGGDRHGLCNAVIVGRKGSSFVKTWRDSYTTFSRDEWNYHSVILPKELSLQYPEQICTLSPTAFFWPTWTKRHIQYMHEPITSDEAEHTKEIMAANSGALYAQQFAYHGWSQVASSYLNSLNLEEVKNRDSRFNVLVRGFLDDQ